MSTATQGLTRKGADSLVGRIINRDGQNYTVVSTATVEESVHVWDPIKQEMIVFDNLATFGNWAYGTPIASGWPAWSPLYSSI